MKPRILLVDDEQNILNSLRLIMRPMRSKWDVSYALGGREALEILEKEPHDVVVTDMRMPGMDGMQLLNAVSQLYPQTARIILSGYTDQESVLKTVKLAHQFLGKPCRPVDLIHAIEKALRLRGVIDNPHMKGIIARLESLPVLPPVYSQLVSALQNENAPLQTLAQIVGQDMAMTTAIMRLVNSAFFGLPSRVSSIDHAVKLIGGETLRSLVLSIHLFAAHKDVPANYSMKMLWDHSLRVSCFAKAIAEAEGVGLELRDDCFIAGLLHDVGKLILISNLREQYEAVLRKIRLENRPPQEVETEVLGTTHAEVGAYLMGLWGFNDSILEAVCWHHAKEDLQPQAFSPRVVVTAANCFDHELVTIHEGYAPRPFFADLAGDLPEQLARIAIWRQACSETLKYCG